MSMLSRLVTSLRSDWKGRRTWTPQEVRELAARGAWDEAFLATENLNPQLKALEAERDCLRGELAFHRRQDDESMRHFQSALQSLPGMSEAHYGLSLLLSAQGKFDDAVRHAQFALGAIRKNGRYLAQLGYCHLCLGNYQVAEGPLRRATLEMVDNPYLWNNLGIVLRIKGEAEEARQCFVRALKLKPDFPAAGEHIEQLDDDVAQGRVKLATSIDNSHTLKAETANFDLPEFQTILAFEQDGDFPKAIDACENLLLELPGNEQVLILLSRLYERVGDIESASDALRAHLVSHPESFHVAGALGLVCLRATDFPSAERFLRNAWTAHPGHLDYVVGLARALSGLERFSEASPVLQQAKDMAPDDLGILGQWTSNLANECRYEEAMAVIDDLTAKGFFIGCKGSVLAFLGRCEEGLASLNDDVARQPHDPGLRFQRAHLNLLLGNYRDGWADYSFRGLTTAKTFRMLPFPLWKGESLKGKRVIVLTEQGLGDQIMFASCLSDLLAQEPERVVVEMSQRIAKTIERSFPACKVIASNQNVDFKWVTDYLDTDCFIPLGDLPAHFRPGIEQFPRHDGYLRADPERIAFWRHKLEAHGPGPYIGVSWRGGTELTRRVVRSLEPEQLLPLGSAVRATWVCLQYGKVAADVQRLAGSPLDMAYWPEAIEDLDEFAALISALDLVVTVCNTTVHYAGALGKPVWILSPKVPEWRYGLTGDTLPWYPSSLMFRQTQAGGWTELVDRVGQELSARFGPV
jgi:tetratricopeptide (TPR) repeat protein